MLKYIYNSCSASGRLGDGLDLVRGQKRHLAFDYKFATQEGAVLFNIHAFDLRDEIQILLAELVNEKMPLWKQMRCLEVVSAIMAETLMEMNVKIYTSPEEIHWPMGCVTRPGAQAPSKSGKKMNKKQGGVFGYIVFEYAPAKGEVVKVSKTNTSKEAATVKSKGTQGTTTRAKAKSSSSTGDDTQEATEIDTQMVPQHEGLPVQERKCRFIATVTQIFTHLIGSSHQKTLCRITCFSLLDWTNDELADVLYLFRVIQLDPNYRNNYKELSRRMKDCGWDRDNNQCRHQIDRMKRRYDTMIEQDKKSGGCLYVEMLRRELNECFGALKDVTPDKVYSCRKGMLSGATLAPESDESNTNTNNNSDDVEAGTSGVQSTSSKEPKKKPKCNYFCQHKFIYCSKLCLYCLIYFFLLYM